MDYKSYLAAKEQEMNNDSRVVVFLEEMGKRIGLGANLKVRIKLHVVDTTERKVRKLEKILTDQEWEKIFSRCSWDTLELAILNNFQKAHQLGKTYLRGNEEIFAGVKKPHSRSIRKHRSNMNRRFHKAGLPYEMSNRNQGGWAILETVSE